VNGLIPDHPSSEMIHDLLTAFDEQVRAEAVQGTSPQASKNAFDAINRCARAWARCGRWWAIQPDRS
jgi:hypothetical protein